MNSKTLNKALLFVTLLTIAQRTATKMSSADIQGCIFNDGKGCLECYQRESAYPSPTCGAPVKDNCEISLYDKGQLKPVCLQCEFGYTFYSKIINGKRVPQCVKGTPENCLVAERDPFLPFPICTGCKAGYYSVFTMKPLGDKCVPESQVKGQLVENCELGGLVNQGQVNCFRCKDGFSRDEIGLKCSKREHPGCLIKAFTDAFKCRGCDYLNGWFMNIEGDCVKVGEN